jgi:hypothetical protein
MFFDEPLWRTLIDFIASSGEEVVVLEDVGTTVTVDSPLDRFMRGWSRVDPEDVSPPWAILVRSQGVLKLAMVTERWFAVGGPMPYADSYTYSLYADCELSKAVLAFLSQAPAASRWRFDLPIYFIREADRRPLRVAPTPWDRLFARLFGERRRPSIASVSLEEHKR